VNRHGWVQKGPFIHGSSITIQELDSSLQPTGLTFQVQTKDDLGAFDLPSTVTAPLVEIIADGYYYDEIVGALSTSDLTLRTISEVSSGTQVRVNILTSLAAPRIRQLVAGGLSFAAARAQAEPEVLTTLGINGAPMTTFDQLDESEPGDSNAILLAASVLLEQAAYIRSPASPVAGLSELIAIFGSDLTGDAGVDPAVADLLKCQARLAVNASAVQANLRSRYASLGDDASVPDFSACLSAPDACGECSDASDASSDPLNCGACGHNCQGGTCVAGACQPVVLASGQGYPQYLAVDGMNVYWTNFNAGTGMKCAKAGCGDNPTQLALGQQNPNGIAVDSVNVYWPTNAGVVMECAVGGCGQSPTQVAASQNLPQAAVADGAFVYWTAGYVVDTVMKCAIGGCNGGPTQLASMQGAGGASWFLALANGNLYWTTSSAVMGRATSGCGNSPTTLASGQSAVGVAADSQNVYWVNSSGTVVACAVGGCSGGPTQLATGPSGPRALAIDATNLYWTNTSTATVSSCPLTGCGTNPKILAGGFSGLALLPETPSREPREAPDRAS
jgi:hypothetical protein